MKKRIPKLPKKLKEETPAPTTSEEFLEQGSIDEESGDRWLGGDMAKALRFYQKAYQNYIRAISLGGSIDSYYNSSRLLLLVHNEYIKAEGVNLRHLNNIAEVLTGDDNSVVQPLHKIQAAHETALAIDRPLDLVYNCVVVYTEMIEDGMPFDQSLDLAVRAAKLLDELFERQGTEFRSLCDDLTKEHHTTQGQGDDNVLQEMNETLTSEETVQPADLFDTVLASYKLVQALVESAGPSEMALAQSVADPIIQKADLVAASVTELPPELASMLQVVTQEQVTELTLVRTCIQASVLDDLDQIVALWESVPESNERNMMAADSLQDYMDRGGSDPWKCLTSINAFLKQAQLGLQARKKDLASGLGLGGLLAQISGIFIMRADVDIQRSQVPGHEEHTEVLLNNARTMLKNAMTMANSTGGLRERMAEKLQREKKKGDAVIRMCLLEHKSIEEMDNIMGRERWREELPGIIELGYYKRFIRTSGASESSIVT